MLLQECLHDGPGKQRTLVKLETMALAPLPRTDVGVIRFRDAQNAAETARETLDSGIGIRKRGFQLSRYLRE